MKILIAEDDFTSRTMLQAVLSRWGYEVVCASDGAEAHRLFQQPEAPQLAVLDWMMPGMDGPTLCRRLRSQKAAAPLYLILLTARGQNEDIITGFAAGADDYIAKPYDHAELKARVRVGARALELQREIQRYADEMETLARQRAVQLAHSDRMATLGILSAGIAHEINNPTSFVAVNIQTLEQNWEVIGNCLAGREKEEDRQRAQLLAEEMPAILRDMNEGVKRIQHIVNGLKTYSHSGGGHKTAIQLADCIGDALRLCRSKLRYGVEVIRELPADLPAVLGDARELGQVFINLFINAVDAIGPGSDGQGRLLITARKEQNRVAVWIRDNGPGLPPQKMHLLFAPFFTTKGVSKGTGLGLSISRNIAEDHDGTLTARNHPEGGAEFTLTLPCARPGQQGSTDAPPPSDRPETAVGSLATRKANQETTP